MATVLNIGNKGPAYINVPDDIKAQARKAQAADDAFRRAIKRRAQVCAEHGIETRVSFCTCHLEALETFTYRVDGHVVTGSQWVKIDQLSPSAFMAWLGY